MHSTHLFVDSEAVRQTARPRRGPLRYPRRRRSGQRSKGLRYGPPVAHRWPEDEEEDFVPWMEVPEPTTIRRLWTYLHEAVHMHSAISPSLEGNNYSSSEAEAELGALRILESEGLKLLLRVLKAIRRRIEFEARKDFKIEVTPAGDVFPIRGQPILPAPHAFVRRAAVLAEQDRRPSLARGASL